MTIPKSFKLFATTYNVVFDNVYTNSHQVYGEHQYSRHRIVLSDVDGVEPLSQDRIKDCFYHEKVHAILAMMNEKELNLNEKFVDTFAKLLRQSDETSEYGPITEI